MKLSRIKENVQNNSIMYSSATIYEYSDCVKVAYIYYDNKCRNVRRTKTYKNIQIDISVDFSTHTIIKWGKKYINYYDRTHLEGGQG
jgi:hypothetical protein